MNFFKQWAQFMLAGAVAHARWEKQMAQNILGSRKRLLILGLFLLPVAVGGIAFADQIAAGLPYFLGGKKAYSPAFLPEEFLWPQFSSGWVRD